MVEFGDLWGLGLARGRRGRRGLWQLFVVDLLGLGSAGELVHAEVIQERLNQGA